jgi:hypothetical protein
MVSEDDYVLPGKIGELLHLTYREWHAFVNGFYRGFTGIKGNDPGEVGKERHYWRAGFIAGWFVKLAVILYCAENFV